MIVFQQFNHVFQQHSPCYAKVHWTFFHNFDIPSTVNHSSTFIFTIWCG